MRNSNHWQPDVGVSNVVRIRTWSATHDALANIHCFSFISYDIMLNFSYQSSEVSFLAPSKRICIRVDTMATSTVTPSCIEHTLMVSKHHQWPFNPTTHYAVEYKIYFCKNMWHHFLYLQPICSGPLVVQTLASPVWLLRQNGTQNTYEINKSCRSSFKVISSLSAHETWVSFACEGLNNSADVLLWEPFTATTPGVTWPSIWEIT